MRDLNICELRRGQIALVSAFDADETTERRLREHGLDEGVEVELLHRAAFGADPLAVRIGSACVAMRRAHAALVRVRLAETRVIEAAE